MTREILRNLEDGATEAFRSYAVLIVTPFAAAASLVARVKRAFSKRTRNTSR